MHLLRMTISIHTVAERKLCIGLDGWWDGRKGVVFSGLNYWYYWWDAWMGMDVMRLEVDITQLNKSSNTIYTF